MDGLNIVMASPEAVPFSKTGGLADVAGALPKSLATLGHDVALFIPYYGFTPATFTGGAQIVTEGSLVIAGSEAEYQIYRLRDRKSGLDIYLIRNEKYFDRDSLYVDPDTGKDYPDNDKRFAFFSRAILEALEKLSIKPDIIQANDWQTALIPIYLKTTHKNKPIFADTATVYTIHNLAYQGTFPAASFKNFDLPENLFYPVSPLEFYGKVNLMKGAIHYADKITTVSPRYAREIQTNEEFGCGLEGVLRDRSEDIHGILNGVDYKVWSPSRDKFAPHHYNPANISGKIANKIDLINKTGMPFRDYAPLIGMVTRLVDQKGFDLFAEIADKLFAMDIQMIIVGTGEEKYHKLLTELESKYPDKLKVWLKFDNSLAHWVEAAADIFLMPSRFEPCGLNQLYSLKYGTLPIVRAVGGLADSVENIDLARGTGTGFVFNDYDGLAMLKEIQRAVTLFSKKRKWRQFMKTAMKQDYSWVNAAKQYVTIFKKSLALQKTSN